MTNYFTYTNNNDGLEAIVATGNDRHDYRVIMNDTDAGKNVTVLFTDSIKQAHRAAREFAYCESIRETGENPFKRRMSIADQYAVAGEPLADDEG